MQKLLSHKSNNLINIITLGLSIFIIYIFVYKLNLLNSIKGIMGIILFCIVVIGGYKFCQNKFDMEFLINCILLVGFVMRIGYMLYTPCAIREHDLGELSIDGNGHASYILNILDGHLPISNEGQFYHPPFYYILSAIVIRVIQPLLGLSNTADIINCAKIVSCFFSCVSLYCVKLLCTELNVKKFIPMSLTAFLPNFYLMGGRANNDSISVFFMILIMLYSIRWYKSQSIKNTVILALSFGLGMMSKISVAMMAIPTGLLMLYVVIKSIKSSNTKKVFVSLCLFGAICVPLGMLYPIRNLVLFNQPFSYVLDIKGVGFSSQNYSFIQRFLSFPIGKILNPVYNNPHTDYNIWMYLLKGALFGEFSYNISDIIPAFMILIYSIISILMVLSAICTLRDKNVIIRYMETTAIVLMISYIFFNIRYPYGCTMDFRYIVPVYIINAFTLEIFFDKCKRKKQGKILYATVLVLNTIFSFLSVLMFQII